MFTIITIHIIYYWYRGLCDRTQSDLSFSLHFRGRHVHGNVGPDHGGPQQSRYTHSMNYWYRGLCSYGPQPCTRPVFYRHHSVQISKSFGLQPVTRVYVVGLSQISLFLYTLEEDMYTAMLDLTTAALNSLAIHIQWTLLNVAKFPEVQAKCRGEIKKVSLKTGNVKKERNLRKCTIEAVFLFTYSVRTKI